jgi:hypothetical protein
MILRGTAAMVNAVVSALPAGFESVASAALVFHKNHSDGLEGNLSRRDHAFMKWTEDVLTPYLE